MILQKIVTTLKILKKKKNQVLKFHKQRENGPELSPLTVTRRDIRYNLRSGN